MKEVRIVRSEDDEYTDDESDDIVGPQEITELVDDTVGPQETTGPVDDILQPEENSTVGPQETTRLVDDVFQPPAVNNIVALQKTLHLIDDVSRPEEYSVNVQQGIAALVDDSLVEDVLRTPIITTNETNQMLALILQEIRDLKKEVHTICEKQKDMAVDIMYMRELITDKKKLAQQQQTTEQNTFNCDDERTVDMTRTIVTCNDNTVDNTHDNVDCVTDELDDILTDIRVNTESNDNLYDDLPTIDPSYIQREQDAIKTTPAVKKRVREPNAAISYIKVEMSKKFTELELQSSRYRGAKRKYGVESSETNTLSPGRVGDILISARRRYKADFEKIHSVAEVFNSKCRQRKQAVKRQTQASLT